MLPQARLVEETQTVGAMFALFCQGNHSDKEKIWVLAQIPDSKKYMLCSHCADLYEYAQKRLKHCPHGDKKPTCSKCPIHCYAPHRRAEIKKVMRYAGPKMLWKHPFLSIRHVLFTMRSSWKYATAKHKS